MPDNSSIITAYMSEEQHKLYFPKWYKQSEKYDFMSNNIKSLKYEPPLWFTRKKYNL